MYTGKGALKFQAFLIKYGEIAIKGKNRHVFEEALIRNISHALTHVEGEFEITTERGRIYITAAGDYDYEETVEALKKVFGIVGICPMWQVDLVDMQQIRRDVLAYMEAVYPDSSKSFKVFARRADKSFPFNSQEINAELGGAILGAYPKMRVDVHNPEILLNVELRNRLNIYSETIPGPGGMPVGTAGKAMLLLSGGIDSPVAGYMIAKRGVTIEATYFHAPPYTSERAKQKVVDLAKIVARYSGPIRLNIVNFTDIQLYIYDKCPHDELTIIMRRYMMKIAEHFAQETGCLGLITGESIGQVASQTMKSLAATNEVCTMPVYRPLIAFDKNDIIEISEKIDTYETSILPYEDCCTIFVAKHPVTKPNLNVIHRSEKKLSEKIDELVETAIRTTETVEVRP
ncbi:MAG: tRNA 4-thiouridine(8) synthase ThiI [Clostridiales bacterium]|nr:tRNA 4-thiouridine(8) synthase ThiI [Clostridiales bacterium]